MLGKRFGLTCAKICSETGRFCNAAKQSLLNTNEIMKEKMKEAGHICEHFMPPRGIAGAPYLQHYHKKSVPTVPPTYVYKKVCVPISEGAESVCDEHIDHPLSVSDEYPHLRLSLCYCEGF